MVGRTPPDAPVQIAVRSILEFYGEDPDREGLQETPARVSRMYEELLAGLGEDPSVHLKKQFRTKSNTMVIIKDLPFTSLCEHHLIPFIGLAHIGYVPGKFLHRDGEWAYRIAGLSKFGRVVDGFARRPQVQEELTHQIAECIQKSLEPEGVIVVMQAQHMCMSIRGVQKPGAWTITSAVHGLFDKNTDGIKTEFLSLLRI